LLERTVSEADLQRLKAEREEADQRYNEALSALDAALQRVPEMPHPPPPLDEHQITPLNQLWNVLDAGAGVDGPRWRRRLAGLMRRLVTPFLARQQAFNAALVDHINRNIAVQRATRQAIESTTELVRGQLDALCAFQSYLIVYLQRITPFVDTKDREFAGLARRITEDNRELLALLDHRTAALAAGINAVADEMLKRWEAITAREQREEARVSVLAAACADLRDTLGVLQRTSVTLTREVERLAAAGAGLERGGPGAGGSGPPEHEAKADGVPPVAPPAPAAPTIAGAFDAAKYVGFEDCFRGSQEEIRQRLADYLPYFDGASDVLDIGCGRGEFLELLAERGIRGRGVDLNRDMVELCRERGLDVQQADALTFLSAAPDDSIGGLIATQVVEHLQPDYLLRLLDAAQRKLRPGAKMILETINPACWFAFFESYIRDITHVRAIHPDTLRYLLLASGFQNVEVRFREPYPQSDKLQPLIVPPGMTAETAPVLAYVSERFNANVERLNSLLFTHLDYVAIGEKG
jgi:SAM-dependent methyltransferase